MNDIELFQRLSVALAIGLLIGVERGWQQRDEPEGGRTAGLRTFAFGALLGGLSAALVQGRGDGGLIFLGIVFTMFSGTIVFYRHRELVNGGFYGATTVVAAMLTFVLGAYAVLGSLEIAGAGGVAAAGLLAVKGLLHGWLKRISWLELRSALVLLAMTFILLPFLPNRAVDPWGAINPFELWLLTILIAAISFAGYIAIKVAGDTYGVAIAGIAGGLASSTAVTVTMSQLAAGNANEAGRLAAGALFANATMFARVAGVIGVVNSALLLRAAAPLLATGLGMAAAAAFLLWRAGPQRGDHSGLKLNNPFEIKAVATFALLLTAISLLTKLATLYAGDAGAYVLAALSGIADVDAITLTMARPGGGASSLQVAAIAIFIALAVNSCAKVAMAWAIGGQAIGWRLALASALAIFAGWGGYWLQALLFPGG